VRLEAEDGARYALADDGPRHQIRGSGLVLGAARSQTGDDRQTRTDAPTHARRHVARSGDLSSDGETVCP
jgi:hypothetical protein